MTLDLEDEYGLDLGFDYEKTATEVINQVLELSLIHISEPTRH